MRRRPPRSTRTDTRLPHQTLFRSAEQWHESGGHEPDIRAMIAHLYNPPRPQLVRDQARALVRDAHGAGLRVGILTNDLRAFHSDEWIEKIEIVGRSEEHTSELQSLMRISYAVFCLKKKK